MLQRGNSSALTNNVIFFTKGDSVLCTTTQDKLAELQGCTHEEADKRMFLHAAYSARHGVTVAIIVSSDADIVVIAVSLMHSIGLTKLWIAFGKGKDSKILDGSQHMILLQLWDQRHWYFHFFMPLVAVTLRPHFLEREKICMANLECFRQSYHHFYQIKFKS